MPARIFWISRVGSRPMFSFTSVPRFAPMYLAQGLVALRELQGVDFLPGFAGNAQLDRSLRGKGSGE